MRVYEVLEDNHQFYIVCELLHEELAKRLQKKGAFSERDTAFIFKQILMALHYLHLNNIVHRDIKLENVLMQTDSKDDLTLKITDFGFAKFLLPGEGSGEVLGSPLYMAPEILLKKNYGTSVDIWAAGVLLHILLVGEPVYSANSKREIFSKIKKEPVEFKERLWKNLSK